MCINPQQENLHRPEPFSVYNRPPKSITITRGWRSYSRYAHPAVEARKDGTLTTASRITSQPSSSRCGRRQSRPAYRSKRPLSGRRGGFPFLTTKLPYTERFRYTRPRSWEVERRDHELERPLGSSSEWYQQVLGLYDRLREHPLSCEDKIEQTD